MNRRHDLDALRVLAFAVLILYHGAMLYVAEWGWHLKSSYQSEWLQWPMLASNRWRMALLFLISGLTIGLCLPRLGAGAFLAGRTRRILLPLLFGMAAIVPVQAYCQGVANGFVEPGFGAFLLRYFSFGPWPEGAFDGWQFGITWNHLWYLAYLWVYCLLLALLWPLLAARPVRRFGQWLAALRGWRLLLIPAVPLMLYAMVLLPRFAPTNDLVNDVFQHAQFFTVFIYGVLLARAGPFWDELARLRRPLGWIAGSVLLAYVLIIKAPLQWSEPALWAVRALRGWLVWVVLLAILAWGRHLLDRPFRWLPYANEAILPWYILHQSLTVLLAWWLVPQQLGPWLEPLLVLGGTVLGCLVLHEYLIRRSRWLRPLFGLKPLATTATAPAIAAAGPGGGG